MCVDRASGERENGSLKESGEEEQEVGGGHCFHSSHMLPCCVDSTDWPGWEELQWKDERLHD